MKELSIEEKAKRYDKALEKSKRLYEQGTITESLAYIFPELKESEDEKIRKDLIIYLRSILSNKKYGDKFIEGWIAWLEAQGEQKSAVEPKFKVGDILVSDEEDRRHIYKVDAITNYDTYLLLDLEDGYTRNESVYTSDLAMYLWTIEDAKDGDVLYLQKDGKEHIIIYKGVIKERFKAFVSAYCAYNGIVDAFCFADVSRYVDIAYRGIMPATKEQRNLLFQKMHEAGYEWDAEKKELKKIKQKPTDVRTTGYWYVEDTGQNSAWSEEDRQTLRLIIDDLSEELNDEPDKADKEILCRKISFLNSLKPQPIHVWSREDNRTRLEITNYLECQKREEPTRTDILNKWIAWIANLDPQGKQGSQWKPSEEMLEALYKVIPENVMAISDDEMLLDKLYQGLKYGRVLSKN